MVECLVYIQKAGSSNLSGRTKQWEPTVSKSEDTLNKAYGNAPKEVAGYFDLDIIPGYRGIKYYFYRLLRWFTR